ncbi:MAG: hypothetical protein KA297_05900 [Kofleriaceae bacterium]|nr:hypothetical protein [Kofleriaceae bacterium]
MSDVPNAKVVEGGKLGGDVPRPGGGPVRPPYKRHLSNFLLDKRLQLRYVLLLTIVSAIISGALGYLIYRQEAAASEALAEGLATFTTDTEISQNMRAGDRQLVVTMALVGVGLVVILSAYLVVMTHKVAGPLFKVSLYFDKMAAGRLGFVGNLRKGDMLVDFYGNFKEMHEAVRARFGADAEVMAALVSAAQGHAAGGDLAAQLAALDQHVTTRRAALS